MKTYEELLAETRERIKEIGVKDAFALRHTTGDVVFVDVREPPEYNLGKIPGAVTISREKSVVDYCGSGNRSAFAADVLQTMGYAHVRSLRGGFSGWVAEGGEVE